MKEKTVITSPEDIRIGFGKYLDGMEEGIISLPVPVANITEWHSGQSYPSLVLHIPAKDLERVIYYAAYAVTDPGETGLKTGDIIGEAEKKEKSEMFGKDAFRAEAGAEAVFKLLEKADLSGRSKELRLREKEYMKRIEELRSAEDDEDTETETAEAAEAEKSEIFEALAQVRAELDAVWYMMNGGTERFLIKDIRLFPLQLRPFLRDSSPYGVYHDIEDSCRHIFYKAGRVSRLMEIGAPEIIMMNEKRILQEAVDTLIANGERGKPVLKCSGVPVYSLKDAVMHGIFRT